MANIIKAPRGTFDILPEDAPLWRRLEDAAREACARYGYAEIRTPIIEETRLFVRGIGDTTDIVEKEMYTFEGKGREDSISLRPEATAGVVRAYIEHNYHKTAPFQKFCYMGPMFRYERPQAGRQRQFNQIGVEVLGTYAPEADVETIALALEILSRAGLQGTRLKVNSIGCPKCRGAYRDVITAYIAGHVENLCGDCKRRYEKNILRVLDCKVDSCRALLADIPEREGYLCDDCAAHFDMVKALLAASGIEFTKDKYLVRGFDYYTRTVYEIAHSALGARDAVGGGGRYDNLVEELAGPPTGAVGFSLGSEATLLALKNSSTGPVSADVSVDVYLAVVDSSVVVPAFKVLADLRAAGISSEMHMEAKSVKAQLRAANRKHSRVVVLVGPDEIARSKVRLKDMDSGSETEVDISALSAAVNTILGDTPAD